LRRRVDGGPEKSVAASVFVLWKQWASTSENWYAFKFSGVPHHGHDDDDVLTKNREPFDTKIHRVLNEAADKVLFAKKKKGIQNLRRKTDREVPFFC
jgi:hypothetical protein